MLNFDALNIAAMLILILLLCGLFATIIGEIISTRHGRTRPRILRTAIERMLNDGRHKKYYPTIVVLTQSGKAIVQEETKKACLSFSSLRSFLSVKNTKALKTGFADSFIQTLPQNELTAATFSNTLCHMLEEGGSGKTSFEKIAFCLRFNTLQIQPETASHIITLLKASFDVDNFKANLQRWFNETIDRTNRWRKRKILTLLFLLFVMVAYYIAIDTAKTEHALSHSPEKQLNITVESMIKERCSTR